MNNWKNPQQDQNRGVFLSSVNGFATTLAVMISVFVAPLLNQYTAPFVVDIAKQTYGPQIVQLIDFGWMVACFPFVFFAARASVGVALMMAGSYVAYRFI